MTLIILNQLGDWTEVVLGCYSIQTIQYSWFCQHTVWAVCISISQTDALWENLDLCLPTVHSSICSVKGKGAKFGSTLSQCIQFTSFFFPKYLILEIDSSIHLRHYCNINKSKLWWKYSFLTEIKLHMCHHLCLWGTIAICNKTMYKRNVRYPKTVNSVNSCTVQHIHNKILFLVTFFGWLVPRLYYGYYILEQRHSNFKGTVKVLPMCSTGS